MKSKIKFKSLVMIGMFFYLSSCQKPNSTLIHSGASKLSTVNVKLPNNSAFKPSQGTAAVSSYKLVVKADSSSTCQNPTSINQIKSFADGTVSQKFAKGCNYLVKLSIGEVDSSGNFVSYYENATDKSVQAKDLEQSPVNIAMQISLTESGKLAYMPESINSNNNPNIIAPPTVIPTPNTNSLPPLGGSLNGNIVDSSGKEVPMSSVFTTEFLVIDFSNPGCGYCEAHAREMNQDTQRQKIYDGTGKCKSITGTSSYSLNNWLRVVGSSSFVGKNSYGHKQGMDAFSSMFGFPQVTGTPTFLFVNRQGQILKKTEGSDPNFDAYVDQQCQ